MNYEINELLQCLPPYQDQWEVIHPGNQEVPEIMDEVIEAHYEFAPYYDKISSFFDVGNAEEICNNLYRFVKNNIRYKEESAKDQTSALPTGILTRLQGDCKHFSGFTAGILDSLKRSGKKIDWCYRFASYKPLNKTPHHVFVVVNPGKDKELWIDATPDANKLTPVWQVDKKVNTMAIRRNIAGFDYLEYEEIDSKVGLLKPADITIQYYSVWPKDPGKKNPYFGNDPFLGLSSYAFDYFLGFTVKPSIGWEALADQINAKIQQGPHPGHTVTSDEVRRVYLGSQRHYNFYYPGGVPIGFTPVGWPANLTRPVLTDDDRLTLSNDKEFPINEDIETVALVAWLQSYIYEFDETPYLMNATELHYFSKDIKGKPGNGDLFKRHKKKTFIKKVGEGIVKGLKFVKDTVFKIVGAIPRNAFLGMVGLNVFNFAKNMQQKIDAGKWPEMAAKWKSLGGNPDKLKNTIEDGADKPEQDKDFDANKIGEPATATAIIAAAAPIIAAMLAFIKDDSGKINDVLAATKNFLSTKFPDVDFGPLGFLDKKTGKQIEFVVDPEDDENINPNQPTGMVYSGRSSKRILLAAWAGLGAYMLAKRKNILVAAAISAAVYFINPTND